MPLKKLLGKLKNRNKHALPTGEIKSVSPSRDALYKKMGESSKPSTWQLPPQ